jgi:hypothetical protein
MMLFRVGILVLISALFATKSRAGTVPDPVVAFYEGFENPPNSFDFLSNCLEYPCFTSWYSFSSPAHTGTYAAHVPDPKTEGIWWFTLVRRILIPADAESAELTFWHRFDFERNGELTYDGGVLEVLTDHLIDLGPLMTIGGYNGTILASSETNPLAGRAGWVGASADWEQVRVDLTSYRGQFIDFQFAFGADFSTNGTFGGWWVDDIEVTYRAPLASCSRGWSSVSSYPNATTEMAIVGVGDALYAFGGIENHSATAAAYRYSPDEDRWTPIASLPERRYGAAAVTDGTSIYIVGGSGGDNVGTGTLWRYDPATNRYLTLKPFTIGTLNHAAVYLNGVIYRIAGALNNNTLSTTASVEAYTVVTDTWQAVADYPVAQLRLAAMALDGYIYTAAGNHPSSQKTYRFDPVRNLWDDGPIADLQGSGGSATGALYNGTWIVFASGDYGLGWDPTTNYWRSIDLIPGANDLRPGDTSGAQVAATANAAYALFDSSNGTDTTAVRQYVESNCTGACLGDCRGDGAVVVSDIVRGVAIALNQQPLSACPSFDGNHDGRVTVNELVTAVGNALGGCGHS